MSVAYQEVGVAITLDDTPSLRIWSATEKKWYGAKLNADQCRRLSNLLLAAARRLEKREATS